MKGVEKMSTARILWFASVLALLGACGDDGNNSDAIECADTCSTDATCKDIGGTGVCECNPGFDGDGITCDANACAGISNCSTEGASCSGDNLVVCAADADGCLVESSTDCTASDQSCSDAGDAPACVSGCSDDPACSGIADGNGFCDGSTPTICSSNAEGCLEPVAGTSCGLEVCDDSAATPVCVANASGDSCAAVFVIQDDISITGADISADYANDEDFAGSGCSSAIDGAVEAVFSADLAAGETIHLAEFGGLDSVLGIMPLCAAAGECYAGVDGGSTAEEAGISYTATTAETVFLYVSAFSDTPFSTDYDIRVSFTQCGNGVFESGEACDDGNEVADDGCTACTLDIGFNCDTAVSPTLCAAPTDLGTYALGEAIPDTVETMALASKASYFYTITFSEDVLLSGTLTAAGAEDIDIFFYDGNGDLVIDEGTGGGEEWTSLLPAGTYTIEIFAFAAIGTGWTMTLATTTLPVCANGILEFGEACDDGDDSAAGDGCTACVIDIGFDCDVSADPSVCTLASDLGSFAGGELIPNTVEAGPVAQGNNLTYKITFTGQVALSGTLNAAGGEDIDMLFLDDQGATVFSRGASGGESWTDIALPAGTYFVRVVAFDAAPTGWTLTLNTKPIVDIGSFAATDVIADSVGGPLTAGTTAFHSITFTTDVVLDGTLIADTGDVDLRVSNSAGTVFSSGATGNETFNQTLTAGTYFFRVLAFASAGDVGTYTLAMSTTAP